MNEDLDLRVPVPGGISVTDEGRAGFNHLLYQAMRKAVAGRLTKDSMAFILSCWREQQAQNPLPEERYGNCDE